MFEESFGWFWCVLRCHSYFSKVALLILVLALLIFWTHQCLVMRSLSWPLLRWCPENNNSPSFPWSWLQSINLQTLLKDGARVWAIKPSVSKNNCPKAKRNNILCGYGYCLVNTHFFLLALHRGYMVIFGLSPDWFEFDTMWMNITQAAVLMCLQGLD